jgi:hypothetical protein
MLAHREPEISIPRDLAHEQAGKLVAEKIVPRVQQTQ